MDSKHEVSKVMSKICDNVVELDNEKDYVIEYKEFDWAFDVYRMNHYFKASPAV